MITHNAQIGISAHRSYVQSYVKDGLVAIDFNNMEMPPNQEWNVDDARVIVRLLTLAIADAELES